MALAASAACLALMVPPASATPARSCRLLTDAAGDGRFGPTGRETPAYVLLPNDPSLDVVSADVASNAEAVTVAIRLAGYERLDPLAPVGRHYQATVTVRDAPFPYVFTLLERAAAQPEAKWRTVRPGLYGTVTWTESDVLLVVDQARSEIRLSVPLAYFRSMSGSEPYASLVSLGRRGRVVTGMAVTTARWYGDPTNNTARALGPLSLLAGSSGNPSALQPSDEAAAPRIRYESATPSCVSVGR